MKAKLVIYCCLVIFPCSLFSQETRMFWLNGELLETGETQGKSFLSLRNESSGKIQHIICDRNTVEEIESQRQKGTHIHLKAKQFAYGSPLLQCMNKPMLRGGSGISQFANPSESIPVAGKRVMGQILQADPDSGLLTIQTALRKTYLKVSPVAAAEIHSKLSQMEVQNIDDTFVYDRNKKYFVGTSPSFR